MTDVHTKQQRSYNMSRIRGKDTKPEVRLRKHLWSKGVRGYRVSYKLAGKPDIAFPKYRVAVFVDGCYWHKCPQCFQRPETNKEFWEMKLDRNVERDQEVNSTLQSDGWTVLRFWEHRVRKDVSSCSREIKNALLKQRK